MDRRHFLLAGAGLAGFAHARPSLAQVPAPVVTEAAAWEHPYAITAAAGPHAILVKSYSGEPALGLAQEFCTELRRSYKLPAYLWNRGHVEKQREAARIAALKAQQDAFLKQMGDIPVIGRRGVKTVKIEDQFAVLIGGYKTMDEARDGLDKVRKLPPPKQAKLLDVAILAAAATDGPGDPQVRQVPLNPFLNAFVVRNPMVAFEKEANESDPAIPGLNRGEKLSVLQCKKDWTLVVKSYQVPTVAGSEQKAEGLFSKIVPTYGKKHDEAIKMQARSVATALRAARPQPYEAYVLHTRYSSVVCVGQFDGPNDPDLRQLAQALAGWKIGTSDALMPAPLPMRIPRS